MKTKFLLFAIFFIPSIIIAQIGIGTTNVDASAKLQIDSENKGFLQPRVTLTGTTDASTIASPATGLMVYNTATAGNGSTAVTPGIYYYTGTTWQRVADQSSATTTTFVNGNLGTPFIGGSEWFAPGGSSSKTCGANITLPPGRWEVKLNLTCLMVQYDINWGMPVSLLMSYWLTDTETTGPLNYSYPTTPTNITSDVMFSGSGLFTKPIAQMGATIGAEHNGSFYINNATSDTKTYYLFFHEGGLANTENYNGFEPIYADLGGSTCKGNRFYAEKIN
jgi:hypothetical protein